MKNFPSALIKQKNTKQGLADTASGTLKNIGSKILKNIFSKDNPGSDLSIGGLNTEFNAGYEILDLEHEIDNININKFHKPLNLQGNNQDVDYIINRHNATINFSANIYNGHQLNTDVYFEDPFLFSSSIFSVINNYKYVLKSTVPSILEHPKPQLKDGEKFDPDKTNYEMATIHDAVSPSLFNPFAGVSVIGITEHVPLIISGNDDLGSFKKFDNGFGSDLPSKTGKGEDKTVQIDLTSGVNSLDPKISDCTIKALVEESKEKKSMLGLATYRYVDFMFCKDLGKISNNHLITLRRFPGPIGDNIFKEANPKVTNEKGENNLFSGYFDIGRLITWFGNEDNKLEDICRFNYRGTWKEFHAEIQQVPSQQQDTGILDKIANTFSPSNNKLVSKGFSSNTGLLGWGASKIQIPLINNDRMSSATYNWDLLQNYDDNKIYKPADTIWDTHKYEGKLEFNQEITLTFRYVLRSYANINPKSAFLDLLGNILTVTYKRGSFWGGETKIFGPQGNNSVYKTANTFIDKAFDELGGIWSSIASGQFSLQQLQGWISNAANAVVNKAADESATVMGVKNGEGVKKENLKADAKKAADKLEKANSKYGWTAALKGMLKNQLGRPAMYATNSLLTGEPVGPWHLTIGNPKNPIMSMGNMIIENSEIQHSGPLGIDDFPTEIKVTITLKHGRPRDSVEIQKMYTKGRSSIYKPMNMMQLSKYKNNTTAFGDIFENDIYNDNSKIKYTSSWEEYDKKSGKTITKTKDIEMTMSEAVLGKSLRNV